MTQIKIFEFHGNNETEVNTWLRENPQIEVISVNMVSMHDLYSGQTPTVCNEWTATIVTYRIPENNS